MKILYILDYVPLGSRAFDHFLLRLIDVLHQKDHNVRFVFAGEPATVFQAKLSARNVDWCMLSFPLSWHFWRTVSAKWPDYAPDLLYTSFLSVFTWPLLYARVRRKFLHWVVSDESSGTVEARGVAMCTLRFLRGRLFGFWVDAVRAVSRFVSRRDIEDMYLPRNRVYTIWNGIDLDVFSFRERTLHDDGLRILYVGQLIPEKGGDTLLQALVLLRDSNVEFKCRIAGDGIAKARLEAFAQRNQLHNQVDFIGFCTDTVLQYHWADVVVIPSIWGEAFGLVAIEAMATGAIVVVSDAGGLPEVVADTGMIVPAGDRHELANALSCLAGDIARIIHAGIAARQRVADNFCVDKTVDSIVNLFERA
jgi:glycosyltransferase involved in cell wall biosynthesis